MSRQGNHHRHGVGPIELFAFLLALSCGTLGAAEPPASESPIGDSGPEHEAPRKSSESEDPAPPAQDATWKPPFRTPPATSSGWTWAIPDRVLEARIGVGRARQLRDARFRFLLHAREPVHGPDSTWRDPQALERHEDAVLSAWGKTVRDAVEEALGLEEWWDRRTTRSEEASRGAFRPSWRIRVSPRLSDHSLGLKLRLAEHRASWVRRVSFRVQYDHEDERPRWMLKFDDRERFVELSWEPGTPTHGDLISLSARWSW